MVAPATSTHCRRADKRKVLTARGDAWHPSRPDGRAGDTASSSCRDIAQGRAAARTGRCWADALVAELRVQLVGRSRRDRMAGDRRAPAGRRSRRRSRWWARLRFGRLTGERRRTRERAHAVTHDRTPTCSRARCSRPRRAPRGRGSTCRWGVVEAKSNAYRAASVRGDRPWPYPTPGGETRAPTSSPESWRGWIEVHQNL